MTTREIELLSSALQSRNFIVKAAKNNCWKTVDELISIGVDVNFRDTDTGRTLSDWAYEKREFETLTKILDFDGPYPTSTNHGYTSPVKEKKLIQKSALLEAAFERRTNLHTFIKNNQIENVKQFIEDYPKLKHAYKAGNRSALSTALEFE